VIDVGPIGQKHIGKGVSRLVAAVRLEDDFFPKHHRGRSLIGSRAVSLTFLWAINATQADTFGAVVVQDFDGVAVEDGDDGTAGSHTQKRQGARFAIEIDAVSLGFVSFFTVVAVGKRLQCYSSEKTTFASSIFSHLLQFFCTSQ